MGSQEQVIAGQIGNILALLTGGNPPYDPNVGLTGASIAKPPGSSGTGTGGMSGSGSFDDSFYSQLLGAIGAPVTEANLQFMRAWNQAEGMPGSTYNPFATTQGAEGATNWNDVGVRVYTDAASGIQATAQTLQNGLYQGLLDALRAGDSAYASAQAVANSPWGTGDLVLRVLGG